MAYNTRYICNFDSLQGEAFTLMIEQKDYTGSTSTVTGAAVPVLHKWNSDEQKATIKGSSLDIRLINENGSLPLSSFFSDEDDTFKVKFYHGGSLIFIGFLVNDDCSEEMLDFTHEIVLSATDNLGLLKDIAFDEAARIGGVANDYTVYITYNTENSFSIVSGTASVQTGDKIIMTSSPINGDYLAEFANYPATTNVQVSPDINMFSGIEEASMRVITPINYRGRLSVAQILNICLKPTNAKIYTNVYSHLQPVGGSTYRWMEDVFIDTNSFLIGDTYKDCYTIMNDILSRFNATIMQAHGEWVIIRIDEHIEYGNAVGGFKYDTDFIYDSNIILDNVFDAGVGRPTVALNGLTASLQRPLRFAKEKFEYKNPAELLRNANFSRVGRLLDRYAQGENTVFEYEMKDWDAGHEWTTGGNGYVASSAQRFIRVTKRLNEELDRVGVIKGISGFDDRACAECYPIEVSAGDVVSYSFDYRSNQALPSPTHFYFIVNLVTSVNFTPKAANNRYLRENGEWSPNLKLDSFIPAGMSSQSWQSVKVTSKPLPFDGILYVKLAQVTQANNAANETYYKNLNFDITKNISDQGNVTGHAHTDAQNKTINNNLDRDIVIDDSPSNAIAGTLFLSSFNGRLQNRVKLWQRGTSSNQYRLGEIITFDDLFARNIQRKKLEGTLFKIVQGHILSALTVVRYDYFAATNFTFGQLEIDYRNDSATGTLYELYKDSETKGDLLEFYTFKYLYK